MIRIRHYKPHKRTATLKGYAARQSAHTVKPVYFSHPQLLTPPPWFVAHETTTQITVKYHIQVIQKNISSFSADG